MPEQVSPFMNGAVVQRLMQAQLDLVKGGDRSAEQAMREAARQVNRRIQENLRFSPELRKQYDQLIARQASR